MRIFFTFLILLSCVSCITKELWAPPGQRVAPHEDKPEWVYVVKEPHEGYRQNEEPSKPIPNWAKVLLTPITLVLDFCTAPIQDFIVDPGHFKREEQERIEEKKHRTFHRN